MLLQEMGNKTSRWSQATARHSQEQMEAAEPAQPSPAQHSPVQPSTAQHSTAQPSPAQPTGAGTLQQSTLASTQHSTEHRAQRPWAGMETIGHLQGLAPFIGWVVCCQQHCVGGQVGFEPSSFHLLKDIPCLLPLLT